MDAESTFKISRDIYFGPYWPTVFPTLYKHNRSEMVAVPGPNEALPYYIHIYIYSIPSSDLTSPAF
jgi:hypothetical protein